MKTALLFALIALLALSVYVAAESLTPCSALSQSGECANPHQE